MRVRASCGTWVGAGRRLVQSAAKPNMRRKTIPPIPERGDSNNRITPNYPIIALIRNVGLRFSPTYEI